MISNPINTGVTGFVCVCFRVSYSCLFCVFVYMFSSKLAGSVSNNGSDKPCIARIEKKKKKLENNTYRSYLYCLLVPLFFGSLRTSLWRTIGFPG